MKLGTGVWFLVIGLVVVGGGVLAAKGGGFFRGQEEQPLDGVAAQHGTLVISALVRGNLKAKDSLTLRNEIEGRTTILSLVDEGTLVEPGDMIAELDTADLADLLVVQKISEQSGAANYTKAREQLAIQRIQNESDIADADLQLEFAKMDFEKYTILDGEWTHELKKAEETIKLAEEELSRESARLEWTQKLYDQGFAQGLELEADKAVVERAKVELEQARRDKALKEQYGHRRQSEELRAAVETMHREVQKTEKQANARLADFEAAEVSTKIKWDLEKEKLRKIEDQLHKGKIIAPIRGMVVYARENSRWGSSEPVQEGKEVHEREELVTIPREGGMIVDASLHETVLKKVQLGQGCKISVDAIPNQTFHGRVQFVAVLADSNAWFANPNDRVYRAEVSIENGVPEMRPGMSCSVDILVAELANVVYVPVQSIFLDGGETIVFVMKDGVVERRAVVVGLDNSKLVEVKVGLIADEIVLLTPPASFKPKAAPPPSMEELLEGMPEGMPGLAAPTAGFSGPGTQPGAEKKLGEFGGAPRPESGGSSERPREGGNGGTGEARGRPGGREGRSGGTGPAAGSSGGGE